MRDPNALLVEMKIGAAPVELVCPLFTKVENGLPYKPATPLLGMYPKNSISHHRDTHISIHGCSINNSYNMEAAEMSIN